MSSPDGVGSPLLAAGVERRDFGSYGIVAAPGGVAHLHLLADEFALLGLMDGSRSAATLAEVGGPTALELLEDLRAGGFLEGAPAPPLRRVTLTSQGIEFAGADRLVRPLYRRVGRYAYTPVGVTLMGIVGLAGLGAFVWQAAVGRSLVLVGVSPVLALVALRALSLSDIGLHELGHAMVIERHDRKVGRIGIGFYWGLLSFYVDATDALFLDRRTRMLQAAAGCITDVVICGIVSLIALVVPAGHLQHLLLQFTILAYISVLLNLVPLLELDGYWFLADLLDRPTLRRDANDALKKALHRQPTDRRLAAYALASATFGTIILVVGMTVWWHVFGPLFHELWNGDVLYKALAIYLVLPFIALALQVMSRATARLRNRRATAAAAPIS